MSWLSRVRERLPLKHLYVPPYNNKRRPTPDLFSILTSFCPLDPSPFSQYIFYLLRPPLTKSPSSLRKGYIT